LSPTNDGRPAGGGRDRFCFGNGQAGRAGGNDRGHPDHPYYKRSLLYGFDFAARLDFGVYGEFAFRMPRDSDDKKFALKNYSLADNLEMCAGFDYQIPGNELDTVWNILLPGLRRQE
jgi:hypothetical protein